MIYVQLKIQDKIMNKVKVCSCGCNIFSKESAIKVPYDGFIIFRFKDKLPIDLHVLEFIKCILCNRYYLPDVAITGRNILDGDVVSYKQLIEFIEEHNARISKIEALLEETEEVTEEVKSEERLDVETVQTGTKDTSKPLQQGRRGNKPWKNIAK